MTTDQIDETTTAEYIEGTNAFLAGEPDSACPYPSGAGVQTHFNPSRCYWMSGYYAMRTQVNLANNPHIAQYPVLVERAA